MDVKGINMETDKRLRVLVAIASYGSSNDRYLARMIDEYRAMPFVVDIVILSNMEKRLGSGVECRVGLPTKNPWSLPFAHKALFAERMNQYDLFIYSEDDILITERNLRAFLKAVAVLRDDEVAGFLRFERASDGRLSYPDVHGNFHWEPESLRIRGNGVFAYFTNEHAACYVLTRFQLARAIKSGGFLVPPHEENYDLLCTAATDPYTQCGMRKLVSLSNFDDFIVHHMSDKYVGRMGIGQDEFNAQVQALLALAKADRAARGLVKTETRLRDRAHSKNYYEEINEGLMNSIPPEVRSVLSVGCGWGATERELSRRGLRVIAVPLDPIISASASRDGVEIVSGDFTEVREQLEGLRFDCILYQNLLHLTEDPSDILRSFGDLLAECGTVVIQSPNMASLQTVWRRMKKRGFERWDDYERSGLRFSSSSSVRKWCETAGLSVVRMHGLPARRMTALHDKLRVGRLSVSPSFITTARKTQESRKVVGGPEYAVLGMSGN